MLYVGENFRIRTLDKNCVVAEYRAKKKGTNEISDDTWGLFGYYGNYQSALKRVKDEIVKGLFEVEDVDIKDISKVIEYLETFTIKGEENV